MARILDAAGAVFAEKGVDGTTMTEIAARSNTAIGSLYRFFPTKESIAATLLERFIHDRLTVLDQLCETVQPGAGGELARALLDVWLDKREERDYTTLLLAARPDAEHHTAQWRAQFQGRVVRILEKAQPGAQASAAARGVVLLHLLKLAPQLVRSEADKDVRTEMEKLVLGLVNAA